MTARTQLQTERRPAMLARLALPWWVLLVTGVAWLIISAAVLRFNTTSVVTIGLLIGAVFLIASVSEMLLASARAAWAWLHILMAVLFIGAAIWAFVRPYGAFWALATVVGLLLILRGSLDLVTSIDARNINPTWWLGLLAGVLEIILGFWASQQAFPARAALLIFWVGFFALFRGISDIVVAFEVARQNAPDGPRPVGAGSQGPAGLAARRGQRGKSLCPRCARIGPRDPYPQRSRPDREMQRREQIRGLAVNPGVHQRRGVNIQTRCAPGPARWGRPAARRVDDDDPELTAVQRRAGAARQRPFEGIGIV
jgi:Short repeat of unknown function (DUF308)